MFEKKKSSEPQIILPDGVREKIETKKRGDTWTSLLRDATANFLATFFVTLVIFLLNLLIRNQFSESPAQVITLVLTIISIVIVLMLLTVVVAFYRRVRIESEKSAIEGLKTMHQEIFSKVRENTLSLLRK